MSGGLKQQRCEPCEGGIEPLAMDSCALLMAELDSDWELLAVPDRLERRFSFRNFHEVMAFANAVAFIAHQQNHHPDLELSYRHCVVRWTTHAAQGLTQNDFICAARTDALLAEPTAEFSQ